MTLSSNFLCRLAIPCRTGCLFALLWLTGMPLALASGAWIDGTPYFFQRFTAWPSVSPAPSAPEIHQLPRFQVGDQKSFYAIDFREQTQYTVVATLRAVGRFCYVFVENHQWQRRVTGFDVETIRRAFDEQTPAQPNRGIYSIETDMFGRPPDIDGDPRILILLLDVRDRFTLGGGFVAGYFSPVNQQRGTVRDPNFGVPFHSNETEMIYLDVDPLRPSSDQGLSVLAHELQHLIHWRYDTNEAVWVNEGCSDFATFACGFGVSEHVSAFERAPEVSLVHWSQTLFDQLPNYGAAFLWMLYLYEHYGGESMIAAIVREPRNGIAGVSAALGSRGHSSDFTQIFSDWRVANYVDDPGISDGRYGYREIDLNLAIARSHTTYPVQRTKGSLAAYGGYAILFANGVGGKNLIVNLVEPLGRFPLDIRVGLLDRGNVDEVRRIELSETGQGYLSVDAFGQETDRVLLLPAFTPTDPGNMVSIAEFEYQAQLGEKVRFHVQAFPNPIQASYWEILVQSTHAIGADQPMVTVLDGLTVPVRHQPMQPVQEGNLFSYILYVHPTRDLSQIHWQVEYLGERVAEGSLSDEP